MTVTSILILAAYCVIPIIICCAVYRLVYFILLRFPANDGCRTCYLLWRIPSHPPYWLLRVHLRQINRVVDRK